MTSRNPTNADDFFSSELNSGPPARPTTTTAARQRRAPPPPPPKKTTGTAPARPTAARTTASSRPTGAAPARPKAAFGSKRPTAAARPKTTGTTAARKPPNMSRPVGSYYGSSSSTAQTPAPAAAANTSADWDWGSPNKTDGAASTTDWSNNNAGGNATTTTSQTNNAGGSGWYSGSTSASTAAAPSPYATPGLAGAAPASSSTTNPNAPSSFTAAQNQPMQAGTGFYQSSVPQQQQEQQQPLLSGAMDSSASGMMAPAATSGGNTTTGGQSFSMFTPQVSQQQPQNNTMAYFGEEAPLLEELGVDASHILNKTKAVVLPFSRFNGGNVALDPKDIAESADMAGPIAFALLLGAEMIFSGKLQFGYIYGFGLFGCIAMTFVVNLVAPHNPISLWTVASILGYSLLPVNVLAFLKLFVINLINLQALGRILGILTVAWSTTASTRLFELGCGLREQRYLIAYPIALLYSAFVLITIF